MTIVEFLLARIVEDEAVARAASFRTWRYDPTKVNAVDRGEAVFAGPRGAAAVTVASTGPANDPQSMADAEHIARHDPARVLAECEAKRRLIERVGNPDWAGFQILALPYVDHPDYNESWRA